MKKLQTYRIDEENIEQLKIYAEKTHMSQAAIIEHLLDILYSEVGFLYWIEKTEQKEIRTPAERSLLDIAKKIRTNNL